MRSCHPIATTRPHGLLSAPTSWRRAVLLFWIGLALFVPSSFSAEPVSKEYQLKAAFLYNFTKYVSEWPTNRFAAKDAPITIGVLGKNPFGDELAKVVQGRSANGHAFVIKMLDSANDTKNVDVLFIPRGQETLLQDQFPAIQAAGVLTVGESEAFATLGGLINFTTEADKIRFEINLEAAEQHGFKLSSQMLKLATVVRRKN